MSRHLSDDHLAAIVRGSRATARLGDAEAHLDSCAQCREAIGHLLESESARVGPLGVPDAPSLGDHAAPRPLSLAPELGRYKLLARLGAGAFGVVFAAYDPKLDRRVALKRLRHARSQTAARLLGEAKVLARLRHPNVVTVHDIEKIDDESFLVMEYVEGETLREWLASHARTWRQVIDVVAQCAAGLAAAHACGIVNRDVKPENVLVDVAGRARVVDFGLASAEAAPGANVGSLNVDLAPARGALLGTPAYMAPEQIRGGKVDARTDVFGLCVTAYEGLYGERPFAGTKLGDLLATIDDGLVRAPPAGANVPSWVRAAIVRGLSADPAARWSSMDALRRALERDPARRRRRVALAVAGVAALAGVTVATHFATKRIERAAVSSCRAPRERVDALWSTAKKADVERSMLATGLPYAAAAWRRTETRLDTYAAALSNASALSCEAQRGAPAPADVREARARCLEDEYEELRAVTDVLARADADVVRRAETLVSSLEPLDSCGDAALLRARVSPPRDADTRTRVAALRSRIADAKAAYGAGRYREATKSLTDLAVEAEGTGYRPVHAEALLLLGQSLDRAGDPRASIPPLERALRAAQAGRSDELVARAATQLGWEHSTLGDAARADEYAARASDAIDALDDEPWLRGLLEVQLGVSEARARRFPQAAEHYARAISLVQAARPDALTQVARAKGNLAMVRLSQGRLREARDLHASALAELGGALGDEHPAVIELLNQLSRTEFELGELGAAQAHITRLITIEQANGSGAAFNAAYHHFVLAYVLAEQGDLPGAVEHARRAVTIREATASRENQELVAFLHGLGVFLAWSGERAEGERTVRRAAGLADRLLGKDSVDRGEAQMGLALVLLERGDAQGALAASREASRIADLQPDLAPGSRAEYLVTRARAELLSGRAAQSRATLEEALARLEASEASTAPRIEEVRVLIAAADSSARGVATLPPSAGDDAPRVARARDWLRRFRLGEPRQATAAAVPIAVRER